MLFEVSLVDLRDLSASEEPFGVARRARTGGFEILLRDPELPNRRVNGAVSGAEVAFESNLNQQ